MIDDRLRTIGRLLWSALAPGLLLICAGLRDARGQAGSLPDPVVLGPPPGSLKPSEFAAPGVEIIGGKRRGGGIPKKAGRGPRSIPALTLNQPNAMQSATPSAAAEPAAAGSVFPGSLPGPAEVEDEGPADGLTLDAAVARLIAVNPDLLSLKDEIPQAEADVLTAGLRTNPLLYADTQFIPYGANNAAHRPIGPSQYDVMVTYPLDVSHKRGARVLVASAARRVVQAQYQDAVRRQIGNLYKAYVDVQSARLSYRSAREAVREQEALAGPLRGRAAKRHEDPQRIAVEFQKTYASFEDAAHALADAKEGLALLLDIPHDQAEALEIRGRLRVESPLPPPLDELVRVALRYRPDLAATRLGLDRADAEVRLAQANRLDDVFVFYDPLTYQDNRPAHLPSGRSWDVGITIPLPVYNRNQGNIARARVNAGQSRREVAALERRVVTETRLAEREYRGARDALDRYEKTILPAARSARDKSVSQFLSGATDADEFLGQLNDTQETANLYRDARVRMRRSMLELNTAVGVRVLP